jgi:DNA-binding MarR family transcriptional regulator
MPKFYRPVLPICHVEKHKAWTIIKRLEERNQLERVPGTRYARAAYQKARGGKRASTKHELDRRASHDREKKIQKYLRQHASISSLILKHWGVPKVTAHYTFKKMVRKGLIERLPRLGNKSVQYRKADTSGS